MFNACWCRCPRSAITNVRAEAETSGVSALPLGEVTDGIALALQVGGVVMAWRVEQLKEAAAVVTSRRRTQRESNLQP